MTIITSLEKIRKTQTMEHPTHDDVRLALPHWTAGVALAMYGKHVDKWIFEYFKTIDEAVEFCEMCITNLPDSFGECVLYESGGYVNAKWYKYGLIVK